MIEPARYHSRVDRAQWCDVIENPLAITSLYLSPPELSNVRIMAVSMHEDGPTVLIKIELPFFPDKPPLRWRQSGFNAAIMELRLFGVSELRLDGWTINNVARISLYRKDAVVCCEVVGQSTVISARGLAADVAGVVGYCRALSDGQ